MTSLSFPDFDACFDRFEYDVFRLETLQHYAVSQEDARLRAFRDGTPRPERSVRTSAWLARIATTTAAGKHWQRVHVVTHPLSEYLRYELIGYVESQAAGEQILIADQADSRDLQVEASLAPDFWLFDRDTPAEFAVLMHYTPAGEVIDFEYTDAPAALDQCRARRAAALKVAVPLNDYLAPQANSVRHAA